MPDESILLGSPLTNALSEVSKKKGPEGATAGHSELTPPTREAIQAGYFELKQRMASLEDRLGVGEYRIKLSMGMYQASGRYFPHIWGAYIPEEAGRCSRTTTQLYVFRKENSISWGICPSDSALKDEKFLETFRTALSENAEKISALFAKGFRGRVGVGRDMQAIESPQEFLKSSDLTLSRLSQISEIAPEKFDAVLFEDLKALLPLYVSIVEHFRANKFWVAPPVEEDDDKRFWLIAAGTSGEMWDAFKSEGMVAISYKELNKNLLEYSTRDEIEQALKTAYNKDGRPSNHSLACYEFAHTLKPGDYIFAKAGKSKLLGFGEVQSDYIYDKTKTDYQHIRKVKWISTGPWMLPDGNTFVTKTLTDVSDYEGYPEKLKALACVQGQATSAFRRSSRLTIESEDSHTRDEVTLETLSALTGKDPGFFQAISRRLEEKQQIIFYGPPGTGKTFIAQAFANWFQGPVGLRDQVQFHPSYSYEDFIEGFRPNGENDKAGFYLKAGVFKQFCDRASERPGQKHIFIIDELNRGNLAQVFGELLFALEYRGREISLPYSGSRFQVPKNVYVIGTMNSADRSIAIIDFAIRRRFDFFEFSPDAQVLKQYLEKADCRVDLLRIISSFTKLNQLIRERRGKQYEVGHSFWMKNGITEESLKDIWDYNIRPLLEEYFFDDPAIVRKIAEEAWGFLDANQVAA